MLYESGDLYEGLASGVPRPSVLAGIGVWLAWGSSYDDVNAVGEGLERGRVDAVGIEGQAVVPPLEC